MELIIKIYHKFRNFILYGIIGCFTSALDFGVFTLLSRVFDVFYLTANCISVLVGITTSFILNRSYNFKVKDKVRKRFIIFLAVGLCGLCLSNIILWIGIDKLQGEDMIVKFMSIVFVVFLQFILNRFVTFRIK